MELNSLLAVLFWRIILRFCRVNGEMVKTQPLLPGWKKRAWSQLLLCVQV